LLSDPVDHIPEDRRERARSALAAAFGRSPVTSLEPIAPGASASSYRVDVAGRPYLLRLESSRRDPVRDPHRSYGCMRAAAEAGLAPAVHHADAEAGVAITDFVTQRPLSDYPGGLPAMFRDLGMLIAQLQEIPAFPAVLDYPTVIGTLIGQLLDSGMFAPGLLDPHREGFARIREAYRWDSAALVSSHNDLNPMNILFDGERLWLIDWETAYRNDPLVDVATLTIFLGGAPEMESALIRSCFGREPDRRLRARLALMGQMVRLFFGCAASLNAAHTLDVVVPATDLRAPTREQFAAAIAEGRLAVASPEAQRTVGKMALASFLSTLAGPAFEEALSVARQG
jgi:aminoglycoside phosphotransferase (APT) family kinase protein